MSAKRKEENEVKNNIVFRSLSLSLCILFLLLLLFAAAPMNGSSDPFADGGDEGDSGNPLAALGALLEASPLAPFVTSLQRKTQRLLDASTPHVGRRWGALAALVLAYALRVWSLQGFYIVTYALGIYNLNLLLGFLTPQVRRDVDAFVFRSSIDFDCEGTATPRSQKRAQKVHFSSLPSLSLSHALTQVDPELEGPTLPSQRSDEFRPFQRRLPEFKFWWASTRSVAASLVATLFPIFDVPVFWPILLVYFCALFFVTMRRQVRHMIKHRYIPFSLVSISCSVQFFRCFAQSGATKDSENSLTLFLLLFSLSLDLPLDPFLKTKINPQGKAKYKGGGGGKKGGGDSK